MSDEARGTGSRPKRERSPGVVAFIAALALSDAALGWWLGAQTALPPRPPWAVLPALAVSLVAAEFLFVRFRYGGHINGLNLMEAALAPLLFAFGGPVAMLTVAASQAAGGLLRRNAPVKIAFNVAQWTLATGIGTWIFSGLAVPGTVSWASVGALVAALAATGVTNQTLFTLVVSLANRESPGRSLKGLSPAIVPGWLFGWMINSFVGMLFVLAIASHAAAAILFPVPLVLLHLAYLGYAGARSDRMRLAGLHRAAELLTKQVDTGAGIPGFLREVTQCFEAKAALLLLRREGGLLVHRYDASTAEYRAYEQGLADRTLEGELAALTKPGRATASSNDAVSRALAAAGIRDCLSAPLAEQDRILGTLSLLDQAGFEGFEAGELAVVEALARQTASILTTSALLRTILDERSKLEDILSNTSDGIFTIDARGQVRSWNKAMELITGVGADELVNRTDGIRFIRFTGPDGRPVSFDRWPEGEMPPESITVADGARERHLSCSYGIAKETQGRGTLIVVARDVTPYVELRHLRRETQRLAAAEAAQRAIVEHLQEALTPPRLSVPGLDLGVFYLASEEAAPTGGDAYDWQLLPNGDVHIAVIDVVGHGVSATKDALSVIHAFRVLAAEGHPLEEMIERADRLFSALDMNLAATVLLVRYRPPTGRATIAAGGHPPPLHVARNGAVTQIAAPGGAVGWPGAGSLAIATVHLQAGDSLMLYTDGLVEAGKDILAGEESLVRHARALAHMPAQRLAETVVQRVLSDGDRRDDTLALVLRRAPAVEYETWTLLPDPRRAGTARRELAGWLADRGIPSDVTADLELIAGELLANAANAARGEIALRVGLRPDSVVVEVENDGDGRADLPTLGTTRPAPTADAGRGLFLVRALCDDIDFIGGDSGWIVRCEKRLHGSAVEVPATAVRADARPG